MLGGDMTKELRADARRNREQVLKPAQRLFATEGLGVSLDEIARRAGVGPGTVHRHFPAKEDLYLAVAIDGLWQLGGRGKALGEGDDSAAVFTLLAAMIANGAENAAVKSALVAAEFDLRTAAPQVAAEHSGQVAALVGSGQGAGS